MSRDPRPLRVVHTSDVHLGAYEGHGGVWEERRQLVESAFSRVIDLANDENADVLVIAGDFFDNDRVSRETIDFAIRQLRRCEAKILLVPGNHDPMDEGRLYRREDLESSVPNLKMISRHAGQTIVVEELDLVVWGRAFLDSDWTFKPLEGIPERLDERWHIVLAHGHVVTHEGDAHRSLPIRQDELTSAGSHWDYVALGHWEPHADVSVEGLAAVYSGAPMPLSDSNTRAGWAVIADFEDRDVNWSLRRVDPRTSQS